MTDKELHKLKKSELLELLFSMRNEIDRLQSENEEMKQRLSNNDANMEILEKILKAVCPDVKEGNDSG